MKYLSKLVAVIILVYGLSYLHFFWQTPLGKTPVLDGTENFLLAKEIANEIAIVFIDTVKDIYKIENIRVVDIAEESENPSNINHKKDIAIFIAGGIVLSSMIILVMYMFDTTIKSADEIEEIFNIPVLASIPINEDKFQNNRKKSKRGGRYSEKRVNSI